MGNVFDGIDAQLEAWIGAQPMFFVATAPLAGDGLVNLSPRGHDCFSVLGPHRVAWVDYTGSGIETIAHLRENGRICLMWCSFGKRPRIVRVHGTGRVTLPGDEVFEQVAARHPDHPGTRAVIVVDVTRVSDSCGFGVPIMEVVGERDGLARVARKRGPAGMAAYRAERNAASIDGLPGYPALPVPAGQGADG
jgi:Pyridoxamine 5'-phosphate oxidase